MCLRSPALGGSTTPMTSDPRGWSMFGITSSAFPHINSVLATSTHQYTQSHVRKYVKKYAYDHSGTSVVNLYTKHTIFVIVELDNKIFFCLSNEN